MKKETIKETIEEACIKFASHSLKEDRQKDLTIGFLSGAKSDSAKYYWFEKFKEKEQKKKEAKEKKNKEIKEQNKEQQDASKVTRVEVIQNSEPYNGRAYTNYNAKDVDISFQDEGRTLKVFLK